MTNWLADSAPAKMTSSISSHRFVPLPDVLLLGENVTEPDNESPELTVARAEARAHARQRRNGSRLLRGTDRQFAEALHREADSLHYKGDYETALVLYHRAANVCPRDSSHGVAARRTAAAISALSHPSKALSGLLPKVRNGAQQSAMICPESAALRASRILSESPDPVSVVPQIIGFFDRRPDFWRTPKTRKTSSRNLVQVEKETHTPMILIRKMEAVLNAGDPFTALSIGHDILKNLRCDSTKQIHRFQATTHRLFALAHVALGRHDRAVASASQMTRAALSIDGRGALLITEALITLGKVHLTFGHLNAAARAWGRLLPYVSEPVPRAWVYHEIGRCHLENGDHEKALELATRCLDTAEAVKSQKWMFHGRLLLGQALAQLGRFVEAANVLQSLTFAGEEAGDARTLAYVRDLEERLMRASKCDSRRKSSPKIQGEDESTRERFLDSFIRSDIGSNFNLHSEKEEEEETSLNESSPNITVAESLYSEASSSSIEISSPRRIPKLDITIAAGDSGDPGEQKTPTAAGLLEGNPLSHDFISTGRTYGVSSPLLRRAVSKTVTPRRRDVSDSETVSTIFSS